MKKRRRYLVKEKKRKDDAGKEIPTSSSIREWECLETANDFYKIKDLVNFSVATVKQNIFGDMIDIVEKKAGEETWIPIYDVLNKYEILEELDE